MLAGPDDRDTIGSGEQGVVERVAMGFVAGLSQGMRVATTHISVPLCSGGFDEVRDSCSKIHRMNPDP